MSHFQSSPLDSSVPQPGASERLYSAAQAVKPLSQQIGHPSHPENLKCSYNVHDNQEDREKKNAYYCIDCILINHRFASLIATLYCLRRFTATQEVHSQNGGQYIMSRVQSSALFRERELHPTSQAVLQPLWQRISNTIVFIWGILLYNSSS